MSANQDDYSFLNNIDQKILVAMILLIIALVGGAIWMNIVAHPNDACTSNKYIYCGESAGHGHSEHHESKPH